MLDPSQPAARVVLWLALIGMIAWLIVRSLRRDRREYSRFKRYRSTKRRQAMLWKWLRESFLMFGGLAVVILALVWGQAAPFIDEVTSWPVIRDVRGWVVETPGFAIGAGVGAVLGILVLTLAGARAARKEQEDLVVVGDIQALLPRNRQELRIGALMSLNAGLVEELLFRLAVPALLFGLTGSSVVAVIVSVLLFGALHAYQGIAGVLGTTIVGVLMMLVLMLSGSILWPIVLHALFNLRSLVLLPIVVHGVHRIDGKRQPFLPRPKPAVSEPGPSADADSAPVPRDPYTEPPAASGASMS